MRSSSRGTPAPASDGESPPPPIFPTLRWRNKSSLMTDEDGDASINSYDMGGGGLTARPNLKAFFLCWLGVAAMVWTRSLSSVSPSSANPAAAVEMELDLAAESPAFEGLQPAAEAIDDARALVDPADTVKSSMPEPQQILEQQDAAPTMERQEYEAAIDQQFFVPQQPVMMHQDQPNQQWGNRPANQEPDQSSQPQPDLSQEQSKWHLVPEQKPKKDVPPPKPVRQQAKPQAHQPSRSPEEKLARQQKSLQQKSLRHQQQQKKLEEQLQHRFEAVVAQEQARKQKLLLEKRILPPKPPHVVQSNNDAAAVVQNDLPKNDKVQEQEQEPDGYYAFGQWHGKTREKAVPSHEIIEQPQLQELATVTPDETQPPPGNTVMMSINMKVHNYGNASGTSKSLALDALLIVSCLTLAMFFA